MTANHLIMGKNTVLELARHRPEIFIKVWVSEEKKEPLLEKFSPKKISKQALTDKFGSSSHQGYGALVKSAAQVDLKRFLENAGEKVTVVMVDAIHDPQNLGALMRAAYCLGADAFIFSKNRGCGITPVVTKAANGASELINVIEVSNLATSLETLHKEGFVSYLADKDQTSLSVKQIAFASRSVVLMGSEEKGVQPLLKKKAENRVHIPMSGVLDSLNVSQALAIFLSWMEPSESEEA